MAGRRLLTRPSRDPAASPIATTFRPLGGVFGRIVLFSAIINLATLTTSLFTMQIYDRVLSSQSVDTLLYLTFATLVAVALAAILEGVRQQVANGVASWAARRLGPLLLARSLEQRLTMPTVRLEALRELSTLKTFLATPTVFSLIDMLWVPLYLAIIYLLHPAFAGIALVGALTLFGLAWLNERITREQIRATQRMASSNMHYAESLVRNSEVIDAMGMADDTVARWAALQRDEIGSGDATQRTSSTIIAVSKFVRYAIQIVLLAVGAKLVLGLELTGGAMIAGSIIVARLLAPIEASMTYWKQFVLARHSYGKLSEFCRLPRPRQSEICLPTPRGEVLVSGVTYVPPGLAAPILRNVSCGVRAGEMLAIVGPSASGKTTLSRVIVGVLRPNAGHVRLDHADTFDWKRSDFGQHIGYLPQDIELLPGSVRENIARFRPDATDEQIVAAARRADCHDMILHLDGGYDMVLSDGGVQLSGGQRQRIGLARALFGSPRLLVLDEPNASLDSVGDAALLQTLEEMKRSGVTTIVVTHRPNLLRLCDKMVVLQNGAVTHFGPARAVMAQLNGDGDRRGKPPPANAANGRSHPGSTQLEPVEGVQP